MPSGLLGERLTLRQEIDVIWEVLGYLALGLACITCAIVIGAAFD